MKIFYLFLTMLICSHALAQGWVKAAQIARGIIIANEVKKSWEENAENEKKAKESEEWLRFKENIESNSHQNKLPEMLIEQIFYELQSKYPRKYSSGNLPLILNCVSQEYSTSGLAFDLEDAWGGKNSIFNEDEIASQWGEAGRNYIESERNKKKKLREYIQEEVKKCNAKIKVVPIDTSNFVSKSNQKSEKEQTTSIDEKVVSTNEKNEEETDIKESENISNNDFPIMPPSPSSNDNRWWIVIVLVGFVIAFAFYVYLGGSTETNSIKNTTVNADVQTAETDEVSTENIDEPLEISKHNDAPPNIKIKHKGNNWYIIET